MHTGLPSTLVELPKLIWMVGKVTEDHHVALYSGWKYSCVFKYFFLIFCWPCISIYLFININQLDALNFIISLFQASTCFEHMCSSSGGQKLYYTASGIITPVGGCPVHRFREDLTALLTMSTWCSKHVEAWNKLIIKFSASSWLILINSINIWTGCFRTPYGQPAQEGQLLGRYSPTQR